MKVAPGDAVLTKFGAGVVVRCFDENDETVASAASAAADDNDDDDPDAPPTTTWASVRLWRRPGESIASCATATLRTEDCVIRKIAAAPGVIVRACSSDEEDDHDDGTVDGGDNDDGIDDAADDDDDDASREEIKEGGGSSGGSRKKLYLIERYLPSEDVYLASSVDDDDVNARSSSSSRHCRRVRRLRPRQISPTSTSAKFYPVLEDLMKKGEAAWSAASSETSLSRQTPALLEETAANVVASALSSVKITNASNGKDVTTVDDVATRIASDASKSSLLEALENKLDSAVIADATAGEALDAAAARVSAASVAATEGLSVPESKEIAQVYEMLRDEDLTVLFERGKERLRELVEEEVPTRTRKALGAMGIEMDDDDHDDDEGKRTLRGGMDRLRRDALASLDKMLKIDAEDGSIVVRTGGGGGDDDGAIRIDAKNVLDPSLLASADASASEIKRKAKAQFAATFDQFSKAASSDPRLAEIFSSVSDRTKSWQETTGRLLQTRTASLFAEGSQRLRARAADVLGAAPGRLRDALGGSGGGGGGANDDDGDDDPARAFAERDVAVARLKTMELGDAVRRRLFDAIERKSASGGGLDAVLAASLAEARRRGGDALLTGGGGGGAGAEALLERLTGGAVGRDATLSSLSSAAVDELLAAGNNKEGTAARASKEDSVRAVVAGLRRTATSAMGDAKETLVAVLSRRSGHRDAALLRLERVFLDLESQMGEEGGNVMSARQIADLASGKGGSLMLFQPVAAKAAREIEVQLDLAEAKMRESKHWNPKADRALGMVRRITRGELSTAEILDMATGYLDDDEVVAKSGGLIVRAESLLDNFEAASARLGDVASDASKRHGNDDAAPGIMDAVAKAGITKETVMKGVEGLDVDGLLDGARSAATDEAARRELVSSAGDAALDFLLKILPSMPVPPFDGVREGLVYRLANLSMAGFRVRKEDIYIEIAGMRAAAAKKTENGMKGAADPSRSHNRAVKASELLIIDVRNISATLDDAAWSFEQTYMPYLKGSGKANTRLWDGAIRLKFELRRRLRRSANASEEEEDESWEPVLCLNDRSCAIGGIELTIQGDSRMAWVANKLVSALKNPLRDYVVSVIVDALKAHSGWLVDVLNRSLGDYWDVVLRTAKLRLEDLPKLASHHVTEAETPADAEETVELVWRERVPLGLNILTNDDSGYLKVIDLPRGTQARKVAQSKQLDPDLFRGATIMSVNGRRYGPDNQVELFAALKDPARPKAILFKIASEEDVERLDGMIEKGANGAAAKKAAAKKEKSEEGGGANGVVTVVDILDEGDIGLKFSSGGHDHFALAVSDFIRGPNGGPLPAERSGKIEVNDLLSHVNGTLVLGGKGAGRRRALELLEEVGPTRRPLRLGFVKPYLRGIVLEKPGEPEEESFGGPSELVFAEVKAGASNNETRIVLKDFALAEGAAEMGGVFVGDNLAFINGIPVGAGCRLLTGTGPSPKLPEVIQMLKQYSPLALTFARAQAKQKSSSVKSYLTSSPLSLDIESAYTYSIPAADYSHLGCQFTTGMNGSDIVVTEMSGVAGPFQRQMKASKWPFVGCRLESVDGEIVPSYVNSQLIVNAMKRRWAANDRVELTFCNEGHKDALRKVVALNGTSS